MIMTEKQKVQPALNTHISKPTYCNPLPTIPYCYPELKAFVFSAAAPSIKLKRIVYSK